MTVSIDIGVECLVVKSLVVSDCVTDMLILVYLNYLC